MKNIQTIETIKSVDDNSVYVDLLNGRFAPTDRIKTMHYFAFEARYTKKDIEDGYRQRLNILFEQNQEFLDKLKQATNIFILTLNGQPTLYSDMFIDEIKKYLEWFSRYFMLYIVRQYMRRSCNQSFCHYHCQ